MIDTKDLWIGDKLRHLATGEVGSYDGTINGKVKLKTATKTLLIAPQQLELYTEPVHEETLSFIDEAETSSKYDPYDFPPSIDLHIEQLDPTYLNAQPERILSVQLQALAQYLDAAEASTTKIVTIIHGKGTGLLKAETEHQLKARESVKFYVEVHQGGAVEVWLK